MVLSWLLWLRSRLLLSIHALDGHCTKSQQKPRFDDRMMFRVASHVFGRCLPAVSCHGASISITSCWLYHIALPLRYCYYIGFGLPLIDSDRVLSVAFTRSIGDTEKVNLLVYE